MTSLTLCFLLLKCQMIVCPSSLHSCVQGTNFSPPSEPPGEIMSFGVSPVNYLSHLSLYTAIRPHGHSRQASAASVSIRQKKGGIIVQMFKSLKVKDKNR